MIGAWPPPGFRHLFPELPAPAGPGSLDAAQRARLALLARAMQATAPLDAAGDNPRIPAGYTYLLQFVAHDMVRTETPFWAIGTLGRSSRDLSVARLRLDTLYGGGPASCPFAYRTGAREQLRIAPIAPSPQDGPGGPPLRDIPRGRLDPPPPGWPRTRPPPLDEALLADPRNDDNSNVAQVTVLFAALHNAIVERLRRGGARPGMLYATAREAATLLYRRMLCEDLLARLLHPKVHAHYAAASGADFLDARGGDPARMALEFCTGAFRCGHAMVRETYRINDGAEHDLGAILRATSGGSAGAMPLSRIWTIRWSRFFEMRGAGLPKPNLSRRLRPEHSPGLLDARFFDKVDETGRIGLAYRDLLSAGIAGLHPVAALWAYLRREKPALAAGAAFAEDAARAAALEKRLTAAGLASADAQAIAADPPLPFYVLFEAAEECQGVTLGTLGSVIVAETMFGALDRDPLPCAGGDAAAELARLAAAAGARPGTLAPLARIADMAGLVRLAAEAPGIGATSPAFV